MIFIFNSHMGWCEFSLLILTARVCIDSFHYWSHMKLYSHESSASLVLTKNVSTHPQWHQIRLFWVAQNQTGKKMGQLSRGRWATRMYDVETRCTIYSSQHNEGKRGTNKKKKTTFIRCWRRAQHLSRQCLPFVCINKKNMHNNACLQICTLWNCKCVLTESCITWGVRICKCVLTKHDTSHYFQ